MGDNEVPEPQPHPGLAEAELRVRAAIQALRGQGSAALLAMRYAELGMILAAQTRYVEAAREYQTALDYIQLLKADGTHEQQRLVRITSLSAPPPGAVDVDLDRLEAEVRVALVEALASGGDLDRADVELQSARRLTKGLLRRRLRRRLDRVAELVASGPSASIDLPETRRRLARATDPVQERALRLRLANGYLDAGDFDAAVRESLLLVRAADEVGDHLVRAGARQVLGLALEGQGRGEEGLAILSDAFRDLRNHGDAAGMIGMAEALARRLSTAGDTAGAAAVLRSTERAAAQSGDRGAELSAATALGVMLDESGDRPGAISVLTDVAARAEQYGEPLARADALHSAAVALGHSSLADDLVEALSLLEEAKRIYAGQGKPDRLAGCDHEAAALLGRNGSYDAASARYRSALQQYQQLPPDLRDTGAWPDEVADCSANLTWLAGEHLVVTETLFRSGGHAMSHEEA